MLDGSRGVSRRPAGTFVGGARGPAATLTSHTNRKALFLAASVALACLLVAQAVGAASPEVFDYLYIEANEAKSSGGHAAVRFDEEVFHFQNEGGLLVLDRMAWSDFVHRYALLGNRPIHAYRIDASEATRSDVWRSFRARRRVQREQLDDRAVLRESGALLSRWQQAYASSGTRGVEVQFEVAGLGYFAESAAQVDGSLERLHTAILREHGDDFLRRRRREARSVLDAALSEDPSIESFSLPIGAYLGRPSSDPMARRVADAVAALAALDVLENRLPLRAEASVAISGPLGRLDAESERRLAAVAAADAADLVRLIASHRPDWGGAFLIGAARQASMARSLSQQRLAVLDAWPEDAQRIPASRLEVWSDQHGAMLEETSQGLKRAREAVLAGRAGYASLEDAALRHLELERALSSRTPMRVHTKPLIPRRPGYRSEALPGEPHGDELARRESRVVAAALEFDAALTRVHGYNLVTRNCVSELFQTFEDAGADLGGQIDPARSLDFIPFWSARSVEHRYDVASKATIASWRQARIAEMRRSEADWLVALREASPLTARSYRRGIDDSSFAFFTDQSPLLRPVFGTLNLAVGLGEVLWGVARWPSDSGQTLRAGFAGVVSSAPELLFGNIRKGTNDWVPRGDRVTPGDADPVSAERSADRPARLPPSR